MSDFLTKDDGYYPDSFRIITDPPRKVFYRGNLGLMQGRLVAVVGSRKCTPYGERVAKKIGRRCADFGVTLVSGLARGIDCIAQRAALEAGGSVIAVLANGTDISYPIENGKLMNKICKEGLVISEYPDGREPRRYQFPQRNRLISALSESVIVVEASFHSGALKTAEYAIEQGKRVYAVPGNVFSSSSMGTNKLIQDGAEIVAVLDDPFWDMGLQSEVHCDSELPKMGKDEIKIYKKIRQAGEIEVERLCIETGISIAQLCRTLTIMEIKGIVSSSMGRIFAIK